MSFTVTYQMMTGTGRRQAATPDEALEVCMNLKLAGAAITSIVDVQGRTFQTQDLMSLIGRKAPDKDRNSGV